MPSKAGGVDILLRAQGAEQVSASLKQTSAELQALGKSGQSATMSLEQLEQTMAGARSKLTGMSQLQMPSVSGFVPPGAKVALDGYAASQAKLQQALDATGRAGTDAARSVGLLGSLVGSGQLAAGASSLASSIARIALAGAGIAAGAGAINAIGSALTSSIQSAAESEAATRKAASALQSVGAYSAEALRGMQEFASSMQRVSTLSDEAALNLASLIARMTGISGAPLERMTRAGIELNAALGTDAEAIARIFAQLQNGEVTGLSRLGIKLDESIPKAERLAAGLSAIERIFGGSAQTAAEGYTGSLARLRNAVDDLKEAIGAGLLPRLTELAQTGTSAIESLTHRLQSQQVTTVATVSEMLKLIDTQRAVMSNSPDYREAILRGIGQMEQRALVEIGLEVNRGDIAEALRTIEDMDKRLSGAVSHTQQMRQEGALVASQAITQDIRTKLNQGDIEAAKRGMDDLRKLVSDFPELRIDTSSVEADLRSARRPIDNFLLEIREKAASALKLRFEAETKDAVGQLDATKERLGGQSIDVLIRGTADFREANAEIEAQKQRAIQAKREIETAPPPTVQVVTDVMQVGDQVKRIPGATLEVSLGPIPDSESARVAEEARRKLAGEKVAVPTKIDVVYDVKGQPVPVIPGAKVEVSLGYKTDDPQAAMAEAEGKIKARGETLRSDIRLKIEGAEDAKELGAILQGLEDDFARARAEGAKGDWGAAKLAEEYRQANLEAKALAASRIGTLNSAEAVQAMADVDRAIRAAQASMDKGLAPESAVRDLSTVKSIAADIRDAEQQILQAPTAREAGRQFEGVEQALDKLRAKYPGLRAEVEGLLSTLEKDIRPQVEIRFTAEAARSRMLDLLSVAERLGQAAGTLDLSELAKLRGLGENTQAAAMSADELGQALEAVGGSAQTIDQLRESVKALGDVVREIDAGKLNLGPDLESKVRGSLRKGGDRLAGLPEDSKKLQRFKDELDRTEEGLNNFDVQALDSTLSTVFTSMLTDAQNFSRNLLATMQQLTAELLKEAAKWLILRAIFGAASGGTGALGWVAPGPSSPARSLAGGSQDMGRIGLTPPAVTVGAMPPLDPVEITVPVVVAEPIVPAPARVRLPAAVVTAGDQKPIRVPGAEVQALPARLRVPVSVDERVTRTTSVQRTEERLPSPGSSAREGEQARHAATPLPVALPRVAVDIRQPAAAAPVRTPSPVVSGVASLPPKPAPAPPPAVEDLRLPSLVAAVSGLAGEARSTVPLTYAVARQAIEAREARAQQAQLSSVLRNLVPSGSLLEKYAPVARAAGGKTFHITNNALDQGTFERWMRTGAGQRAMEALANAGAD